MSDPFVRYHPHRRRDRQADNDAVAAFLETGGAIQTVPDSRIVTRVRKAKTIEGKVLLDLSEF